ncbi:hypothetical protein ACVS4I_003106 [Vibrio fluvialis]
MNDFKKRIAAAKERMRNRHKDKDQAEISMMVSSFQGLSPEQIKENFDRAMSSAHKHG